MVVETDAEVKQSSRSHGWGCAYSTPALMSGPWRPLVPLLGSGRWLPAMQLPPAFLLVERRPFGALALLSFLPVSEPKGRQFCNFDMESISSFFDEKWSGGDPDTPSGFVPSGGRSVSMMEL